MTDQDARAISAIPMQLAEAWNHGDGTGFAAPFTETADFIAFEGTHLTGRDAIAAFHQPLFDTVLAGSQLRAEVRFARLVDEHWAVMHAAAAVTMPGRTEPSPGRSSMQLFVATKSPTGWSIEAVQNARQLTLERQQLLDDIDALSPEAQHRLGEIVASVNEPE